MDDQIELQERQGSALDGHYEQWTKEHETVSNQSRWIPTEALVEFFDHFESARAKLSCEKVRLVLIGAIEEFLEERCVPGHFVFGPYKRFPENRYVRYDEEFWKTHFDQTIKCLRCCGISDVDREFFLEQKFAAMVSEAEKGAISRDVFESSQDLVWRNSSSKELLSEFEKQQQVLKLQKALLDLQAFKREFSGLIARIEGRINRALKAVEND